MGFFRTAHASAILCAMAMLCAAQTPLQVPPVAPQQPPVPTVYPVDPLPGSIPKGPVELTPEEKRQQEIDRYNPLNPLSPVKKNQPGDPAKPANPDDPPRRKSSASDSQAPPIPGSIADSAQPSHLLPPADGPVVTSSGDDSSAPERAFNGPAVLSRSYTISRPLEVKTVKWAWSIGSSESWTSGTVNGATSAAGSAAAGASAAGASTTGPATNGGSFSAATNFGIGGRHLWRRDQIGLNYSATYSKYFSAAGYSGLNQDLGLDYEHYFSPRLAFNLVENGAILSQNATLRNALATPGVSAANLNLAVSPETQVLDQKTRQSNTSAGLTWQQSARLSFSIGESFFAIDRGSSLVGTTGLQSQADVNYRWSRTTTVGLYFSYSSYEYTRHVSTSDSASIGLIYSWALNRATQLRLRGGYGRTESLSLTQVAVDPTFAALTGHAAGIVDAYHRSYSTDISAQFVRDLGRRRSMNFSAARGVAPGNGTILTAIQQTLSAGYGQSLFRTWLLNFSAGKSTLLSESQNSGSYSYDFAAVNISHAIPKGPSAVFSATYRRYSVTNMPGLQKQIAVSTGLSWSPGPGKLW